MGEGGGRREEGGEGGCIGGDADHSSRGQGRDRDSNDVFLSVLTT